MGLLNVFTGFHGDYFSDRLVRVYSTSLFLIVAAVIALNVYSGQTVDCWTPSHFSEPHVRFTARVCETEASLYYFEQHKINTADFTSSLRDFNFAYLKAFPVVLALQTLLFLLPWVIWKWLSTYFCNLNTIITEASTFIQSSAMPAVASAISSEIQSLAQPHLPTRGKVQGGYMMSFMFLFIRLFYWIICIVQMGIISIYLNFNFVGFKIGQPLWQPYTGNRSMIDMENAGNGTEVLSEATNFTPFPRVVYCQFEVSTYDNYGDNLSDSTFTTALQIENVDCLTREIFFKMNNNILCSWLPRHF